MESRLPVSARGFLWELTCLRAGSSPAGVCQLTAACRGTHLAHCAPQAVLTWYFECPLSTEPAFASVFSSCASRLGDLGTAPLANGQGLKSTCSKLLGIVLMLGVAVGCDGRSTKAKPASTIPTEFAVGRSAQGSGAHLPVPLPEQRRQAQANLGFAVELLRNTAEGKNAVVSGFSVSLELAMLSAGAQGDTATGLADAAQFVLPQSQIHDSFRHLSQVVQRTLRGNLSLANAIWIQQGLTPKHAFLDVLRTQYGAGVFPLDFEHDPGGAVATINGWTSRQTRGLIPMILQEGALKPETKIALTNALYINAAWSKPFDATRSMPLKFWLSDDASKLTPFMIDNEREVRALASPGLDILFLSTAGGQLETIFMVPKLESLLSFEKSLSAARITELLKQAVPMRALVELPRYTVESSTSLKAFLRERGASKMFDDRANFKGITDETDLCVDDIFHRALVRVRESGIEAAAATAAPMIIPISGGRPPPTVMRINRPFFFMIWEPNSETALFVGRVVDPSN